MERHVENTRTIVAFLAAHPLGRVGRLSRAARRIRITRSRKRLLPRGCGAVFSFDLKGDARSRAARFIETLQLFSHLANVGDAKSLVIHPASTTHFRMSADGLAKRRHHRRHDPAVDRARGSGRSDRRPRACCTRRARPALREPHLPHPSLRRKHLIRCRPSPPPEAPDSCGSVAHPGACTPIPAGAEFDGGKPCFVFVHGAQHDHSVWLLQSRFLAHHGYSVLALDLPRPWPQ